MIEADQSLKPDWDEDNINHIAAHGLRPDQVEEVYYRPILGELRNEYTPKEDTKKAPERSK